MITYFLFNSNMLSIVDFKDCCYSNINNEDKHKIFVHLAHHLPQHCLQFDVCGKVYKWWYTYCDIDDNWYATNSLIESSSNIKIGKTFVSKSMPEFFEGYLILYNHERNITFMINVDIQDNFDESSFYINGIVHYTEHFAYYQSNYSKHYYILTRYTNNVFKSITDSNTYEYLDVDRVFTEFIKSDNYFVIKSGDRYYISHIKRPDKFYKIDSVPDNDTEADAVYKQFEQPPSWTQYL